MSAVLTWCLNLFWSPVRYVTWKVCAEIHHFEMFFFKLQTLYAFTSQMFFFVLCSIAFDEYPESVPQQERYILMALKTLLFYSVFTYFVARTRSICTYNESFCKILIEWAKAVIVVICLREQGISFKPSLNYATTTSIYYLGTEKIYLEMLQTVLQKIDLEIFDALEHLYVPLILNALTVSFAVVFEVMFLQWREHITFAVICSYFVIYLRLKDSYFNYWKFVEIERHTFASFKTATDEELEDYDDICAVCLNRMTKAKITPCNHYFHPNCLKECIKTSLLCPICKYNFL